MVYHPALEVRVVLVTPLDEWKRLVHQMMMLVAPDKVHFLNRQNSTRVLCTAVVSRLVPLCHWSKFSAQEEVALTADPLIDLQQTLNK